MIRRQSKKNNVCDIVILVFWCLFFLIHSFVVNEENMSSESSERIIIPYINANSTILVLGITLLTLVVLVIFQRIRFDKIFPVFLIRIALYFIPMLYITGEYKWGLACAIFQTMFAYYIGCSYGGNFKKVVNIMIVFSLVMGAEIVSVLLLRNLSIFDIMDIKYYMRLPIGQTNTLGCLIVIIYIVTDVFYAKSRHQIIKTVYFLFLLFCLLATGTRSGIILMVLYYVYKFVHFLFVDKVVNVKSFIWKVFLFATLVLITLLVFIYNFDLVVPIIKRFTIDSMSENRIKVYSEVWSWFLMNPILGRSAYSFHAFDASKAHNWLLESLVQTGIVGTAIYLILLYSVYRKTRNIQSTVVRKTIRAFIIVTLIHGSVEPNLFSFMLDTFFWFFVGAGVSLHAEGNDLSERVV